MKKNMSWYILWFCYGIMVYAAFVFYPKFKNTGTESIISWDVSGYYLYLPAICIYHDIKKLSFKDEMMNTYHPTPDFQQAFVHEKSGNYVLKYSSGQALTMFPFFIVAHTWASFSSAYPADGFSMPYQLCIAAGMLLYAFLGLFFLRKTALLFFKESTVSILLLCYVVGSNYLNYAAIDMAMTHNVLFTIYCLLMYVTIRYHEKPDFRKAFYIGGLVGLATLIRPTEIISCLLPVLWNINRLSDISKKWLFIWSHYKHFLVMGIVASAILSVQLLYWKYVSGEWIVYSYGDQGFSWLSPHILDYTFSYHSGWLMYAPMMLIPMAGLLYYFLKGRHPIAIVGFILLNFYIVTAWDIWDYGGRAMVQSYPVLAFPFAMVIEKSGHRKFTSFLFALLAAVFAYVNIWWTYHAHKGNAQVTGMTKAYYHQVMGRWHHEKDDLILLDNPDRYKGQPQHVQLLYENDFSADTSANVFQQNDNSLIKINGQIPFSSEYVVNRPDKPGRWIRAEADITCTLKEWEVWKQTQFIMEFTKEGQSVQTHTIRVHRLLDNGQTRRLSLDAKTPDLPWDALTIFFWHVEGDKEVWVDNLTVTTFE